MACFAVHWAERIGQPSVVLKDIFGKRAQDGHDIVARCYRHLVGCRYSMICHIVLGSSLTTK